MKIVNICEKNSIKNENFVGNFYVGTECLFSRNHICQIRGQNFLETGGLI